MKVLLFITSFGQIEELKYFVKFFKRLDKITRVCDIFLHCNNVNVPGDFITYFQQFEQPNKTLYITSKNAGYERGDMEKLSDMYDAGYFSSYDYVIQLHPDVYMFDDTYLMEVLHENLNNDTVFFITKSVPDDPKFFSMDFYMFKPKLLTTNIFKERLYTFTNMIEHYFCDCIVDNNIKFTFIKRFNNDLWTPRRIDDNLRLYHEHDLEKVKYISYLLDNGAKFF
jgi:hypothetical protein